MHFQLGHVVKVHAVNAGQECHGNENGGENRQYFHYLVHLVADAGDVDIQKSGDDIPVQLDRLDDTHCMVRHVPQVDVGSLINQPGFAAQHFIDQLPYRGDVAPDADDLPLQALDTVKGGAAGLTRQKLVLERGDGLVQ